MVEEGRLFRRHSALFLGTSADPVPEQLTSWLCHVCARAAAVGAALPMAAQNALRSLLFFSDYPDLHKPRLALAPSQPTCPSKTDAGEKIKKKIDPVFAVFAVFAAIFAPVFAPVSAKKTKKLRAARTHRRGMPASRCAN